MLTEKIAYQIKLKYGDIFNNTTAFGIYK